LRPLFFAFFAQLSIVFDGVRGSFQFCLASQYRKCPENVERIFKIIVVKVSCGQTKGQLISKCLFGNSGNALARVQRVHQPTDLWDITFCTRWFWGIELSFIEQTAPADSNS
jgi:hypothetical protein